MSLVVTDHDAISTQIEELGAVVTEVKIAHESGSDRIEKPFRSGGDYYHTMCKATSANQTYGIDRSGGLAFRCFRQIRPRSHVQVKWADASLKPHYVSVRNRFKLSQCHFIFKSRDPWSGWLWRFDYWETLLGAMVSREVPVGITKTRWKWHVVSWDC